VPSLSGLDRFVRPTRHFRAGLLIVPSLRDCVAAVTVSRVSRFVACRGSSRVAVRRAFWSVVHCGQSRSGALYIYEMRLGWQPVRIL
jgi:hypothetical protein